MTGDRVDAATRAINARARLPPSINTKFAALFQYLRPARSHAAPSRIPTASSAPYEVAVAALLPCFWIYWEVGKHLLTIARPHNPYQAWIDTYADEAFARGVRQYVLLGAGLDTFGYRHPHDGLRFFEVDHPATQA